MKFSPVDIEERKGLDMGAGDTVRVSIKIQEKGKTRLQAFEGLMIARKHGAEPGATFTVRKVASGVGMEKIFPLYSPNIAKIEILKRAKTRRSKLYYIREKAAKEARRKMKQELGFARVTAFDDSKPKAVKEDEAIEASVETPEVEAA
ncbi:MAG TPA: 50S ribosomal protein L19 [Candidatus Paceibacterota bacterium]